MEFLDALLRVSEKAANIARSIRREEHLFKLLIEKKNTCDANPRFIDDFKTLADVLIQEMVKHDIGSEFPEISGNIKGEESNVFCNKLGESIVVEIKEEIESTALLLENVLNGDKEAAFLLAQEIHKSISFNDINTVKCTGDFSLDISKLGIWIDPIDSTAEYINAIDNQKDDISISGLNCVTILIGAYDLDTGEPIIGVINQPFQKLIDESWVGECFWGISKGNINLSSLQPTNTRSKNACLSSTEDEEIKWKLKKAGLNLIEAAGAGYKILTVIKGQADCYILSKNSTFKWDTCGPQAILKSLGGDIVNYKNAIEANNIVSLKYTSDSEDAENCNEGGLIAFGNKDILEDVIEHCC